MSRGLREIATSFCDEVEREERRRVNRAQNPGGQHVPNHSDFAQLPPSAFLRLKRWAGELRSAMAEDVKP